LLRNIADDRQSSYALVNYIYKKMGHKRVAIIRADNRYGRVGTMEFKDAALRVGHPHVLEVRFDNGDTDFSTQLNRIKKLAPDAILIWGNAKESALILNQIRKMEMDQPVYCSDRTVNPEFLKIAGRNAENIITTCQYNPDAENPKLKAFQINYENRFNQQPDVFAAHAYDGMNILIDAIKRSGLNRTLIRDTMLDLKTYQGYYGVTGELILDPSWNDIGAIYYAEVKNNKFVFSHSALD
jgi:ABC-type branched-subunit amino acid transport system substrate-binding protein